MFVVFPTSPADIPGGTPLTLAAFVIENFIVLPTSAANTPGGTPIAWIASEKGIADGPGAARLDSVPFTIPASVRGHTCAAGTGSEP
jgi:hypothetical protein